MDSCVVLGGCCHSERGFPFHIGGLGVRLRSPKVAFSVRNRPQPSATVRNRLRVRRKALHSGECVWSGPESVLSWLVTPQLQWRLQRCLCERSVSPQLYGRLQRRCLYEWSVWPHLYWRVQRGSVCVTDLWHRSCIGVCREGVCVSDLCRRSYTGVCRGGVCVSDLYGCSFTGVCREEEVPVSTKSVSPECQVRLPPQDCQLRVSYRSVK